VKRDYETFTSILGSFENRLMEHISYKSGVLASIFDQLARIEQSQAMLAGRQDAIVENLATAQRMIQSYAAGTNQHVTNMEMDLARHVSLKVDDAFATIGQFMAAVTDNMEHVAERLPAVAITATKRGSSRKKR
jgi:hypothetical protein